MHQVKHTTNTCPSHHLLEVWMQLSRKNKIAIIPKSKCQWVRTRVLMQHAALQVLKNSLSLDPLPTLLQRRQQDVVRRTAGTHAERAHLPEEIRRQLAPPAALARADRQAVRDGVRWHLFSPPPPGHPSTFSTKQNLKKSSSQNRYPECQKRVTPNHHLRIHMEKSSELPSHCSQTPKTSSYGPARGMRSLCRMHPCTVHASHLPPYTSLLGASHKAAFSPRVVLTVRGTLSHTSSTPY